MADAHSELTRLAGRVETVENSLRDATILSRIVEDRLKGTDDMVRQFRDEWRSWLRTQAAEHDQKLRDLRADMDRQRAELDARVDGVYANAWKLTAAAGAAAGVVGKLLAAWWRHP